MNLTDLITEHQAATLAFDRSGSDRAFRRMTTAADAVIDFPPATIEEARQKARYLVSIADSGGDPLDAPALRRVLESLAA